MAIKTNFLFNATNNVDDGKNKETLQATTEDTLINKSWHKCRRMIYVNTVPNASGHWPIPEPYTGENDVVSLYGYHSLYWM